MTASRKTTRPAYTEAQRLAILSPGHTLLEAGAGSGKTTTLVGKILHALGAEVVPGERTGHPCDLAEIAAITFTTAAAADLRRSLRERLRAEAIRTGERRWHRLVYEVDRARIGTIHGFCSDLLREFGLRVGLDPRFGVLDAGEAAALHWACVRDRLLDALRAGDDAAEELVFRFSPDGAVEAIADAVTAGDAARLAHERWCDASGPRLDVLRARHAEAGGEWTEALDDEGARLGATVLRLAVASRAEIDRRLDQEHVLDYDALIYRARDLLRSRPDAVTSLRRRLAWLFIDEFQDTDPAQRDIAYLICGVGAVPGGSAPSSGDRCPSLCIVGDPKQSIYGFRRADVTLWNAVARDFVALGAEPIALDTNFRSRAPILGYVNATFGALMPAPGDGAPDLEVCYRPLTAARSYAGDDGLVELLVTPPAKLAEVRRTEEARLVARRVRAMVDGAESLAWDGEHERTPVRWRDVALLFRSRTDIWRYEAELRRLGVPCYVAAGDGFYRAREVRDIALLLRAVSDAHDDLAWLGLLRSPLVGLGDDALLRLRSQGRGAPLARTLDVVLPGEDGVALAAARAWIEELQLLRDRVPPAALIERALERSGYAAYLLYQPGGDVALANVRKLVRIADGRPGDSLAAFVAFLEERAASAAREPEAPLHTSGEDVVTLMTVHGAKGLEWPVVFLCDLDREMGSGNSATRCCFDVDEGIGVRLVAEDETAPDGKVVSGAYERLRARELARDVAEEKRVWYVASTRARERLVLCAALPVVTGTFEGEERKVPKRTPARWLLERVQPRDDALRYAEWSGAVVTTVRDATVPAEASPPPFAPPSFAEVCDQARVAPELLRRVAPAGAVVSLFRRSATELMVFARDPAEHHRSYLLGLRTVPIVAGGDRERAATPGERPAGDGLDARTVGDIVHAAMELDVVAIERDLDALLEREVTRRLGAEGAAAVTPSGLVRLRDLVESARGHEAIARLLGGDAVEHELPFTWFVMQDGGVSVLHGAMDLVATVNGGVEVLDFKTHRIAAGAEPATAAGYDIQRDLYGAALAEVLGVPAVFSFFFPETGGEVRHAFDAVTLDQARERVCLLLREAGGMATETPA